MSSATSWILYQDDDHEQSDTNSKRDMGVLLISLLAKEEEGLELGELSRELRELDLKIHGGHG